jgi:hypothetical protein
MIPLTGARVFEWDDTNGKYRIWKFAVKAAMPAS